jgi:hypothetical protein
VKVTAGGEAHAVMGYNEPAQPADEATAGA